jgi:hypothetical protein
MIKKKLYEEIKQELDNIENELVENCQEQLKILEPEFKKLNFNGPMNETEFSIFMRYNYYKSQEERIKGGEEYLQQQTFKSLLTLTEFFVKNHERIGKEYPDFMEKYKRYEKHFIEFVENNKRSRENG